MPALKPEPSIVYRQNVALTSVLNKPVLKPKVSETLYIRCLFDTPNTQAGIAELVSNDPTPVVYAEETETRGR